MHAQLRRRSSLSFYRRVLPHQSFFFFNHPATTEIYTLSLHDALPISSSSPRPQWWRNRWAPNRIWAAWPGPCPLRSEEHTSELQSLTNLVCRLLLEKKKQQK